MLSPPATWTPWPRRMVTDTDLAWLETLWHDYGPLTSDPTGEQAVRNVERGDR